MKKILITVFVIIFLFVAIAGVVFYILYQKATDLSEADKLNTTESKTIYEPLLKSVVLHEAQTVTDDDVNGLLKTIINNRKEKQSETAVVSVNGIAVYMQNDNQAKIYMDIVYKDVRMIFSALTDVRLDTQAEKIYFDIQEARLGSLSVSKDTVMEQLKKYTGSQKNSFIEVENHSITVPSKYSIPLANQNISMYIEELSLSEGKAEVKTNSAMNIIGNFLSDYLLSMIN